MIMMKINRKMNTIFLVLTKITITMIFCQCLFFHHDCPNMPAHISRMPLPLSTNYRRSKKSLKTCILGLVQTVQEIVTDWVKVFQTTFEELKEPVEYIHLGPPSLQTFHTVRNCNMFWDRGWDGVKATWVEFWTSNIFFGHSGSAKSVWWAR